MKHVAERTVFVNKRMLKTVIKDSCEEEYFKGEIPN